MSDTDSDVEVRENADRSTKFGMSKVNRNPWKENGDLNCRVSNPKIITVSMAATEHYCQGCNLFALTHDHCDGKCKICVAAQRLNYAYENWKDEGGQKVVVNEVTLRYMYDEHGLDFGTIIACKTGYRPNMPLGKNGKSFHEMYMELDAKWRVEQEPYTGSKKEIIKTQRTTGTTMLVGANRNDALRPSGMRIRRNWRGRELAWPSSNTR